MTKRNFSITQEELDILLKQYPNTGKNSDIGKFAVEIAKRYFLSINQSTTFTINRNGIDLSTNLDGIVENYEIKGTAGNTMCWNKLKISSQYCHDQLVNGMTVIRITNIGFKDMVVYFLKHGEDFKLIPEPRWSVVPVKASNLKGKVEARNEKEL